MNLDQWDEWPHLEDFQLQEIAEFKIGRGPDKGLPFLIADPDFAASHYAAADTIITFKTWHALRYYNAEFIRQLKRFVDNGSLVDDINAAEDESGEHLLYAFEDNGVVEVPKTIRQNPKLKCIRAHLKHEYPVTKSIGLAIMSYFKKKVDEQAAKKRDEQDPVIELQVADAIKLPIRKNGALRLLFNIKYAAGLSTPATKEVVFKFDPGTGIMLVSTDYCRLVVCAEGKNLYA